MALSCAGTSARLQRWGQLLAESGSGLRIHHTPGFIQHLRAQDFQQPPSGLHLARAQGSGVQQLSAEHEGGMHGQEQHPLDMAGQWHDCAECFEAAAASCASKLCMRCSVGHRQACLLGVGCTDAAQHGHLIGSPGHSSTRHTLRMKTTPAPASVCQCKAVAAGAVQHAARHVHHQPEGRIRHRALRAAPSHRSVPTPADKELLSGCC